MARTNARTKAPVKSTAKAPAKKFSPGPKSLLLMLIGGIVTASLLYFMLLGFEYALVPVAVQRVSGWRVSATNLAFWMAPIPVLVGPVFAWKRRLDGATQSDALRFAGATWVGGAALFGSGIAIRYIGA